MPTSIGISKKFFFLLVLYSLCALAGFFLLYSSRSGDVLLSPWQAVHPAFVYIFFCATLLVGLFIFSRLPTKWLLGLLVCHSLLLHSYLPLTHQLIYGADGWRHIAAEARILTGEPSLGAVITTEDSPSLIQRADIGALSYAQLRWFTVLLARILPLDLIFLNAWLVPVLWSVLVPLLLYAFGRALHWTERQSFFLVWLSFLPFALTATGSLTLPNSFGFLPWLAATVLLIRYINGERRWLAPLIILGIIITFGYALYAVIFLLQIFSACFIQRCLVKCAPRSIIRSVGFVGLFMAIAVALPAAEYLAGYATVKNSLQLLAPIKQLIGNLSAFYLAAGPRPHDIATGNIIFNQVPAYAFVSNLFIWSRWWLVVFSLVFFTLVIVGVRLLARENSRVGVWFAVSCIGLFGAYVVSRYFLGGEQVMTRRLDSILALFFVIAAAQGITFLFQRLQSSPVPLLLLKTGVIIVLSAAMVASYTLGPDTQTVSLDEYRAMRYVWQQEQSKDAHCVIAETYPLLVLEAISLRRIIGGGFPINRYFAQPELSLLLKELPHLRTAAVAQTRLEQAKQTTHTENCWIIGEYDRLPIAEVNAFGKVRVWSYTTLSP